MMGQVLAAIYLGLAAAFAVWKIITAIGIIRGLLETTQATTPAAAPVAAAALWEVPTPLLPPAGQVAAGKKRDPAARLAPGAIAVLGLCLSVSSFAAIHTIVPVVSATPRPIPTLALASPEPNYEHYGGTWFWWSANYSPDGKRIVTTQDDHRVRVWDAQTGKQLGSQVARWDFPNAEYSPDGSTILTPEGGLQDEACTGAVWDRMLEKQLTCLSGQAGQLKDARYNPAGTQIVTAGQDGTTRVWDAASGKQLMLLGTHDYIIEQARFSPDGKQIAAAGDKQHVEIWDATTGKSLASFSAGRVAYSPDGKHIVLVDDSNGASVLDTATWTKSLTLAGHSGCALPATYSPDGTQIFAWSADGTACIWDAQTGQTLYVLDAHPFEIWDAVYSPDSRYIAITTRGDMTQVWDAKRGARVAAVGSRNSGAGVVAFSPDSTRLFTGHFDGSAHVWDTAGWGELVVWNLQTANATPQPGPTSEVPGSPPVATLVATRPSTPTSPQATATPRSAGVPLQEPNWRTVLSDSFDENKNGWETSSYYGDTFKTSESIADGKYHWEVEANHSPALDWELPNVPDVTDFTGSVDGRQLSGTPQGRYGLIFRWMEGQHFYLFDIAEEGTFKISQGYKEDPGKTLLTGKSDAIKPGEVNRLTVIGQGSHFTFFVNGQSVGELEDASLTYGSVGVAVELPNKGDQVPVEFDDFEVRAP